ncbi:hypothetical protein BJF85_03105 [Saccharomonospora sp. CUA-673]|uniref:hypothetical protein n=1 Tax=Saccharomonospora sp. CUA-673 TaxID=1904969 RepID=UPI000959CABA|nr:hypothetical protein [Saccharomonospora sp. CUA-673]OLT43085.1 hypothetical protein BJF85_03105 [Saccharomonospora sp. CUA-673]
MDAPVRPNAHRLEPSDLTEWGLHAFALGARSTPHGIVALDDNGALLYAARDGATLSELEANGIAPSQSQLKLLQVYDLIEVDDDRVTTAFPVVGPDIFDPLRPRIRQLATDLTHKVSAEVRAIREELRRRGHHGHDYAVVFGHAVDGLLWDRLRATDMVPDTGLSLDRPLWNGAFWAIYPPIPAGAGVNEISGEAGTLVMVWTESTRHALQEVALSETARQLLKDPTAQIEIPVLVPDMSDMLHVHSVTIAETIAETLTTETQAQALFAAIPNASAHERTLIVVHELIWALTQELVSAGYLQPLADEVEVARQNLNEHLLVRIGA